ncbi:MAG: hypothetical protein COW19_03000 [Zetaproteobacteria bacterium CG12_big_fil_rev_8_21_14_0_65_55_1124]|nr:MAG: hypothetical protein COT53_05990 [Zetaproteobacteria bacterium CG08_land_8_20_14_0_20_55_17]PIW43411.1 MAG: hypothetical protein COW19_03000 [Zetaproteobacteria bacterium CG12_big_fil_rev_8_21_14_0_65_55_1124]PIY53607.1 MAG: hypothetical protein COZ01_03135 [Zetaproteobacteria bacterium CG_4_10_14_0_8_um_filter_55_43]PIZ37266.1 MAG: hypothetical protein COY36_09725 [Zetaproteobacteria bacterium CG_4_10_14_0_2_um_filter_55_20]PJB81945.1 MAG: hypothetical protein CO089_02815 [Zetaproteoba
MAETKQKQGKIVRTIKTHNDVFEGTAYKKQNNGLRMALFYSSCALVLVLASYGGLYVERGNLHDGVLKNDAATMVDGINFDKTNRTILGQMPGILDNVVKDPNDKYAASMDVVVTSPKLQITTDNLVDLLIKAGFVKKTMNGLEYTDFSWKTKNWSYSHLSVDLTSKENPEDVLTLNIAKDGSLLIWRVVGVFMSKPLLDRMLE